MIYLYSETYQKTMKNKAEKIKGPPWPKPTVVKNPRRVSLSTAPPTAQEETATPPDRVTMSNIKLTVDDVDQIEMLRELISNCRGGGVSQFVPIHRSQYRIIVPNLSRKCIVVDSCI